MNHKKIQGALVQDGVAWSLNPPAASHCGGIWESLTCSVKRVLNSVPSQQSLNDAGLQTILCEVEVNSTPRTKASDKIDDLETLTPNHILLFYHLDSEQRDLHQKERRWRQVQYIAKRWPTEYLTVMQERQNWSTVRRRLTLEDIVIIADATARRNSWMMGKVLEAKPDAKGRVRTVRL